MTDTLTLTLPTPPSLNSLYRNVPGKGRVRTQRYNTWKNAAGWEIAANGPKGYVGGPVTVDIICQRRRSNQDVDNMIKAILDLLVDMALIDDDRNVRRVTCEWGELEGARVEVTPYRKESQ